MEGNLPPCPPSPPFTLYPYDRVPLLSPLPLSAPLPSPPPLSPPSKASLCLPLHEGPPHLLLPLPLATYLALDPVDNELRRGSILNNQLM